MNNRRRLSESEREQRRRADRERVKAAASELLSSEGWRRWVRAREMFHAYSASNCMLIALQCHQRGIVPEHIAGFRTWIKLGRAVRKGEQAIRILAPIAVKQREADSDGAEERHVFFKTTFVFDVSQTNPIPGVEAAALHPPRQPLTGDSHGHLLAPLAMFAESLGYAVAFRSIPGAAGGWCDPRAQRIGVDADVPPNAQVRTLVHEITHALGVDYAKYSRAQAEVIVDTTTLIVLSAAGLDVSGETIPYVAGWGESGALDAVSEFAQLIDSLARRIAHAIEAPSDDDLAGVGHTSPRSCPTATQTSFEADSSRGGTRQSRRRDRPEAAVPALVLASDRGSFRQRAGARSAWLAAVESSVCSWKQACRLTPAADFSAIASGG
jgi:N-terminal domain of anti-restriction factor ArdC